MNSLTLSNQTSAGSNVTAIFAQSNVVPTLQPNLTSCAEFPANNPAWTRSVTISPEFVFISRGVAQFAFKVDDLVSLAIFQTPGLSWPPLINNQPNSVNVVHNSGGTNSVTISVTAGNTESTISAVGWFYSNAGNLTAITNAANINSCIYTISNSSNVYSLACAPKTTGQNGVVHMAVLTNLSGNTNTQNAVLTIT